LGVNYLDVYGTEGTVTVTSLDGSAVAEASASIDGSYSAAVPDTGRFLIKAVAPNHHEKYSPDTVFVGPDGAVYNLKLLHSSKDQDAVYEAAKGTTDNNFPIATYIIPESGFVEPLIAFVNPPDNEWKEHARRFAETEAPEYSENKVRPKYYFVEDPNLIRGSASDTITASFKVYFDSRSTISGGYGINRSYCEPSTGVISNGYAVIGIEVTSPVKDMIIKKECLDMLFGLKADIDNKKRPEWSPSIFAEFKNFATYNYSLTFQPDKELIIHTLMLGPKW